VAVRGSLRPANFTGLGLLLWKLVDRRDAGRHAVPLAGAAGLASGAAWRASSSIARDRVRRSTSSMRSSSRARQRSGRPPAPCAAAVEDVKKIVTPCYYSPHDSLHASELGGLMLDFAGYH
jgi:hypothetical protein